MKLYIAQALITDESLCYIDDNDDVVVESFLGAHDTLEGAQAFLTAVANEERKNENDLIDECETGEAHLPEIVLNFTHVPKDKRNPYSREHWISDSVEFANRGMTEKYQVFVSSLNPTL